ncbi:hypothetical protein AB6N24_08680 [Cellulomonas sp. 179-A 4D5 NHS]|uniref:hypothetical protein n=1 Tax=Cellulomonas sp. 179-A 4D5 NHS TaxID=3142378 RepID=UPI0039A3BFBA
MAQISSQDDDRRLLTHVLAALATNQREHPTESFAAVRASKSADRYARAIEDRCSAVGELHSAAEDAVAVGVRAQEGDAVPVTRAVAAQWAAVANELGAAHPLALQVRSRAEKLAVADPGDVWPALVRVATADAYLAKIASEWADRAESDAVDRWWAESGDRGVELAADRAKAVAELRGLPSGHDGLVLPHAEDVGAALANLRLHEPTPAAQ